MAKPNAEQSMLLNELRDFVLEVMRGMPEWVGANDPSWCHPDYEHAKGGCPGRTQLGDGAVRTPVAAINSGH